MRLFWAAILATLAGCVATDEEKTIYDTIPADSHMIARVDLDDLLKMTGCDSERGVITLTPALANVLSQCHGVLPIIETAARNGDWLDLSQSYFFTLGTDNSLIFTAPLKEDAEAQPDSCIETRNRQAWIADGGLSAKVDSALALALRNPAKSEPGLADFLASAPMAKARFSFPKVENPLGEDFDRLYVETRVSDRLVTARAYCADGAKRVDPYSSLSEIDPVAFLGMPNATIAAVAAGIEPSALKSLPQLFSEMPMHWQISLNIASELLDDNGGTIALAFAPGGNAETIRNYTLDNWLMRAILPTGDKGEGAAELINHVAPDNVYAEADSLYTRVWSYDPFDSEDPYYSLPTSIDAAYDPSDRAVAFVTIPYRSESMKAMRLARGYDLKATLGDSCATVTLRVLGPSTYILPALVQDLNKLRK